MFSLEIERKYTSSKVGQLYKQHERRYSSEAIKTYFCKIGYDRCSLHAMEKLSYL